MIRPSPDHGVSFGWSRQVTAWVISDAHQRSELLATSKKEDEVKTGVAAEVERRKGRAGDRFKEREPAGNKKAEKGTAGHRKRLNA